ncbi:hypothetical protein ACWEDZ_38390, partial [Streptomyces sp. NPDC005047]
MERMGLEIGDRFTATMPWSEVCVHMRVADKVMEVEVLPGGAQLHQDGRKFSSPITWGAAGSAGTTSRWPWTSR